MTAPLLNSDDWTAWVTQPTYVPPEFPDASSYRSLPPAKRARVRDRRIAHNAREVTVLDGPLLEMERQVRRRHILNQHSEPKARYGFVLSGPPRTGKSTWLMTFGKRFELQLRDEYPDRFVDSGGPRYTPVLYASFPQDASEKTISKLLAENANVPYLRKDNEQDITRKVLRALQEMGTQFLLFDEIHNLGPSGSSPADVRARQRANDYLKNFCNHSSATPFFAGVDVERAGLFNEFQSRRATQTAGRFTSLRTAPYPIGGDAKKRWLQLILAMAKPLHLYSHDRGDLARLATYLHDRTGGYIATLAQLIREAGVLAVEEGEERITRDVLEVITVDKQSTDSYQQLQSQAAKATAQQAKSAKRKTG